ncbi:hypothetical protein G7Y89_g8080 [Cudoniella acicularis]|uniref:BTB domain-containing protein n=1 Tax=Cudoniella acicularis TaxID=354080 RepID=A0A8H4W3X6_9HELO|nr:hypothetical protein G7Y89_g8080 [Cudoniella acicularis]
MSSKNDKSVNQAVPINLPASNQKRRPNLIGPQPMVTIHITSEASEPKTFLVHKNFICYYSPYFRTAFASNFIEGVTQELSLSNADVDLKAFGIFVQWLYSPKLEDISEEELDHKTLIRLWLLADWVMCPSLQNETLTLLDKVRVRTPSNRALPSSEYHKIYDNTNEDSPLRRYVVDTRPPRMPISNPDNYPHEMLVDVINRFALLHKLKNRNKNIDFTRKELEQYMVAEVEDNDGNSSSKRKRSPFQDDSEIALSDSPTVMTRSWKRARASMP